MDNSDNEDGFNIYIGGYCDNCQDVMIGLKLPVLANIHKEWLFYHDP